MQIVINLNKFPILVLSVISLTNFTKMASFVDRLVDKQINLLTNDGRVFSGILKSFD